jgi:hypothetical protein
MAKLAVTTQDQSDLWLWFVKEKKNCENRLGIPPHTEQHVITFYVMLPHHHKKRTTF